MFNNNAFNQGTYNDGRIFSDDQLGRIIFDGYSLTQGCTGKGPVIQTIDNHTLSNIQFDTVFSTLTDGGTVVNRRRTNKIIPFTLAFLADTNQELIDQIDEFKKMTRKTEGILDILVGNSRRIAKATMNTLAIPSFSVNATKLSEIQGTFEILEPEFKAKNSTSQILEGVTGNRVVEFFNEGSKEVSPVFYFFLNNVEDLTQITMSAGETQLVIDHEFQDNNILIVNGVENTVTVNGQEIQFDGPLQEIPVDFSSFNINFNSGSTINIDISILYNDIYL